MGLCLGFDTSNYTTSAAVFDGKTAENRGRLLTVPDGTLGLRQSDALFQHTKRLHLMMEQLRADGVMGEIRGVDIWVNFTETAGGVLCEIRSSRYNINQIAVKYGGGGHEKASGATLANREEAMRLLADLDRMTEVNS